MTLYNRCFNLSKPPWRLSQQPWPDRYNNGGSRPHSVITLYFIPPWLYLQLRLCNNHRRWRYNLDGTKMCHVSFGQCDQPDKYGQNLHQNKPRSSKVWLECHLECSDTRWASDVRKSLVIPAHLFRPWSVPTEMPYLHTHIGRIGLEKFQHFDAIANTLL